jgi:hypothetical protein
VRLEVFIVQLAAITSCSVMDPAAGQGPAMWAMPCNASDPTQQWALTSDPMGTSSHGRVHHPVYLSRNSLENIPGHRGAGCKCLYCPACLGAAGELTSVRLAANVTDIDPSQPHCWAIEGCFSTQGAKVGPRVICSDCPCLEKQLVNMIGNLVHV